MRWCLISYRVGEGRETKLKRQIDGGGRFTERFELAGDLLGQLPFTSTINKYFNLNFDFDFDSNRFRFRFQLSFNCSKKRMQRERNAKTQVGDSIVFLVVVVCVHIPDIFFVVFSTWLFKCGTRRCYRHKFFKCSQKIKEKSGSNCFRFWVCNFYSTAGRYDPSPPPHAPSALQLELLPLSQSEPRLCPSLCLCLRLMIINFILLFFIACFFFWFMPRRFDCIFGQPQIV